MFDYDNKDIKIGDRICGKKTGQLIPATVIGIVPSCLSQLPEYLNRWDELYPEWKDKFIIYAEFDEPCKNISMIDSQECMENYYKDCPWLDDLKSTGIFDKIVINNFETAPEVKIVAYPIDDVEVL